MNESLTDVIKHCQKDTESNFLGKAEVVSCEHDVIELLTILEGPIIV